MKENYVTTSSGKSFKINPPMNLSLSYSNGISVKEFLNKTDIRPRKGNTAPQKKEVAPFPYYSWFRHTGGVDLEAVKGKKKRHGVKVKAGSKAVLLI